jgi:hypothetical protein
MNFEFRNKHQSVKHKYKSEIRISKFETNPNDRNNKFQTISTILTF